MHISKDTHEFSFTLDVDAPHRWYSVGETPIYTVNDVVTGTVTLRVKKDISVKDIQVKISGRSKTKVSMMVKKGDKVREETETTDHELVYDVETLFPPLNVKQVSKNSKFTLVPGEYVHHFALKFPFNGMCGDPQSVRESNMDSSRYERSSSKHHRTNDGQTHVRSMLPPSFTVTGERTLDSKSVDKASITYQIKASLHRGEMLAPSTRLIRELDLVQPGPVLSQIPSIPLITYYTNAISSGNNRYRLKLITQQTIVPGYQEWQLMLQSTTNRSLTIDSLSMGLEGEISISSAKFTSNVAHYLPLRSIQNMPISSVTFEPNPNNEPVFKYQTDLSKWLDPVDLSHSVSDFTTCNISIRHALILDSIIEGACSQLVARDITVSGPPLEEDEYANIYGHRPSSTFEPSQSIQEGNPPIKPQRPTTVATISSSSPIEEVPPPQPQRPEQLPSYEQAINSSH